MVITHYQRLLNYIVPDIVHVLSKGRIVKTGGKELALELEASGYAQFQEAPSRRNKTMAELTLMKNAAEQQLAAEWQAREGQAAGRGAVARGRVRALCRDRAAASARRGVEVHRSARADARCQAAGEPARCRREGAREGCRRACSADVDSRRLVFVDGAFVPELSDLADLETGLTIRPMAQALAAGDALVDRTRPGASRPTMSAVALNTAFMGDGVVIHVAAGAAIERPIHLVFAATGDKPAALFTRSLVVVEKGARAMLVESHEGADGREYQANTALEIVGRRRRRMSITSRSRARATRRCTCRR